jgi:hypothetical protein
MLANVFEGKHMKKGWKKIFNKCERKGKRGKRLGK